MSDKNDWTHRELSDPSIEFLRYAVKNGSASRQDFKGIGGIVAKLTRVGYIKNVKAGHGRFYIPTTEGRTFIASLEGK